MLAESRQENFQISLWNYIEGRYSLTAKYFRGVSSLDTSALSEWVEFSWQNSMRKEIRTVKDKPGNYVDAYINAMIYVRPSDVLTRITRIHDTVVDLLRRPVVTVKDWVGDGSEIAKLEGQGIEADNYLGVVDDLNVQSMIFHFCYIERFDRYTS